MQWSAATGFEILIGSPTHLIQPTSQDVRFDATIPLISQELLEPFRKAIKFLRREKGDDML